MLSGKQEGEKYEEIRIVLRDNFSYRFVLRELFRERTKALQKLWKARMFPMTGMIRVVVLSGCFPRIFH